MENITVSTGVCFPCWRLLLEQGVVREKERGQWIPVGSQQEKQKEIGSQVGLFLPCSGWLFLPGESMQAVIAFSACCLSERLHDLVEASLGNEMNGICTIYGIINCKSCQYKKLKKMCHESSLHPLDAT